MVVLAWVLWWYFPSPCQRLLLLLVYVLTHGPQWDVQLSARYKHPLNPIPSFPPLSPVQFDLLSSQSQSLSLLLSLSFFPIARREPQFSPIIVGEIHHIPLLPLFSLPSFLAAAPIETWTLERSTVGKLGTCFMSPGNCVVGIRGYIFVLILLHQ